MSFSYFRKETSERSDTTNWAKRVLIDNTDYYYDSIEGCNENDQNIVTLLMERARVDYDGSNEILSETFAKIKKLEGNCLIRKINFAHTFGINLTYYLYNDEYEKVWMYEIYSLQHCEFIREFSSYKDFSYWIQKQKGWKSTKPYRERKDLPNFDKKLRMYGCAWPTNIDCFISNKNNEPIGILEFQNAKKTKVRDHCNNKFFLCEIRRIDSNGRIYFMDDIRRWLSQEILRVQSGLRLFVITWSQTDNDFILKEIDKIMFPEYQNHSTNEMKDILHEFTISPKDSRCHKEKWDFILNNFQSYMLKYENNEMKRVVFYPPLNSSQHIAPRLYYKYKNYICNKPKLLSRCLDELIINKF